MFFEKDGSFKTPLGLATTAEGKAGKYLLTSVDRSACLFQLFCLYFQSFARFDNFI